MRLENVRPTMKAVSLYDDGLKGGNGSIVLYEVLKVGRAKVKVRDEFGREGWIYPVVLEREITEERYAELMEETHGPDWRSRASGNAGEPTPPGPRA